MSKKKQYYKTTNSDRSYKNAVSGMSDALASVQPIQRTSASNFREFRDVSPRTSVRDGFTRFDYEYFRDNEAIPRSKKDIISICMAAYYRVGLIRNIIDLMGDFASQGIRIVHPNKSTEKFYQAWFEKVGGKERSERFLNLLYRCGNVVVKRASKKLKDQQEFIDEVRERASGSIDTPPNELPWKYYFLDPLAIERESSVLSTFCNTPLFSMKIPRELKKIVEKPSNEYERELIKEIPPDIIQAIKDSREGLDIKIILDPARVKAFYYKKDDWMPWAHPMIYAILDDLILLEKMKLADLTALDGAVSHIRLWTLGDIEHDIFPTEEAVRRLSDLLMNTAGNGSVLDLIWGPGIQLQETNSNIYQFLGSEKYSTTLSNIFGGLGIPQMLTGNASRGGMTDNFIQIKTLVKRLEYGRDQLKKFWQEELEIVRKVMRGRKGFSANKPAEIVYDHMSLTDEAAQTKLILDMLDREIISIKSAREDLGYNNDIESSRLRQEMQERSEFPKVSPYHAAQPELDLKKIFAQRGVVTPSEVGVSLEESKPDEEKMREDPKSKLLNAGGPQSKKLPGKPGQGRPKTSTDKQKRKQRTPLIAELLWAQSAYDVVSDITLDILSQKFNKANLRKFTSEEYKVFEDFKFGVLCNIEPFTELTTEVLTEALNKPFSNYSYARSIYSELLNEFVSQSNQEPTTEQKKQIYCLAYLEMLE